VGDERRVGVDVGSLSGNRFNASLENTGQTKQRNMNIKRRQLVSFGNKEIDVGAPGKDFG
jgi:hypothetical protein